MEGGGARSDEAVPKTVVPVKDIESSLAAHVHPLIASLFERFIDLLPQLLTAASAPDSERRAADARKVAAGAERSTARSGR